MFDAYKVVVPDSTGNEDYPSFSKIPDDVETTCRCPRCHHPHYIVKKNALKPITCENCNLTFQYTLNNF